MPNMPTTLGDQMTYTSAGRAGAKSSNYPGHKGGMSGDVSYALTDQTHGASDGMGRSQGGSSGRMSYGKKKR